MAITTFFYNSSSGDRVYDSTSMENWLKKFFTTGVFQNEYQVTSNNNMTVTVGTGYANINGKVAMNDAAVTLTLEDASSNLSRIDSIVLRRNDPNRLCQLMVIKGSSSSSPVVPTLTRTDSVYDICLANISVAAGATSIKAADITDTRPDSSVCGWITGTVEEIDASQMLAQLTAQFGTWFDKMKGQLTTDAAGHLQTEIDDETARAKKAESENATATSDEAERATAQETLIKAAIATKQDKTLLYSVSIGLNDVKANTDNYSSLFPYYVEFSINDVTVLDAAEIYANSLTQTNKLIEAGYNGSWKTDTGTVRFYFTKNVIFPYPNDFNVAIMKGTVS